MTMKTTPTSFVIALALLAGANELSRGQAKIGTTAAQFLGIAAGPKALAMGGAYVASNTDATGLYWNPGSVGFLPNSQVVFSSTEWLAGTDYRWVGAVLSFDGVNFLGASLTNLDYGEDLVTTEAQPDGTGERWSASDIAFALTYTRRFTDRFSIGGSAKYIQQRIYNSSASTFAMDFGLLFVTGFNDMRLGMSISNFGGDMTLDGRDLLQPIDIDPSNSGSNKNVPGLRKTDAWPIPLLFRVGVAMDVLSSDMLTWTVAADALRPSDNVETVNIGTQIGWGDLLFLRAGVRGLGQDEREEGYSVGGGIRLGVVGLLTVEADYAYTQFGLFGNLNTLAVGVRF
jgi:opacity protein-like surface antigen